MTHWAVVDLSQTLPSPPLAVARWRWYARYLAWWLGEQDLAVIPWDIPKTKGRR